MRIGLAVLMGAVALVTQIALVTQEAGAVRNRPSSFAVCGACHQVRQGAPNGVGPNLWGVSGRVAGSVPRFNYSPAMKNAKIKWDRPTLIAFITNPKSRIPQNRMAFGGQKDPKKAAEIADYLLSLK